MNRQQQPAGPPVRTAPVSQGAFAVINEFQLYYENFVIPSNCQSISFKNLGDVDLDISGYPINAKDAMVTMENQHIKAVDITRYDLKFKAGMTGIKKLLVCRTYHDFSKSPKQNI